MTATDVHAPTLGETGEPCRECGAPLAADQRYCLQCGARRGEPRVDHTVYTGAAVAPAAAAAAAAARGGPSGSTIVASVATLVLALGVGVLIGNAGDDGSSSGKPAPAQVIKVTGGAASAPAATTPPEAAVAAGGAAAAKHASKKKGASSKDTSHATKSTNSAIKKLNSLSPKEYQKQSQKLPKTVGTGGKAPPKDHKPAAGGGSFDTIG